MAKTELKFPTHDKVKIVSNPLC